MVKLYTGPIKKLELNIKNIGLLTNDSIRESVVKDSIFYKNAFGNIVNFEYDTVLFSREEAMDGISALMCLDVLFVDYDDLKYFQDLEKREVRKIKKIYKNRKRK